MVNKTTWFCSLDDVYTNILNPWALPYQKESLEAAFYVLGFLSESKSYKVRNQTPKGQKSQANLFQSLDLEAKRTRFFPQNFQKHEQTNSSKSKLDKKRHRLRKAASSSAAVFAVFQLQECLKKINTCKPSRPTLL